MIQFKVQLKAGVEREGLALVMAHGKMFRHGHFVWSTGHKVPRKGFDPARPGRALKSLLKTAEDALESLTNEGSPISSESLRSRIELIKGRYRWEDKTRRVMLIWDGAKVHDFSIPDGTDREALENSLGKEVHKVRPDFQRIIDGVKSKGANTLFGFWAKVISGQIKAKNGKQLKPNTIKAKKQTMEILSRYQQHAGVTLDFDNMDMKFYQGFMQWMETVGKESRDKDGNLVREPYDINSRGKNVKDVKAILNLARLNQFFEHDNFSRWPIPKEKNEVVTITKEELLQINALELSGILADCRDLFVLACFLGPRISDYKAFDPESLSTQAGVTFFTYTQEKTGTTCKIPVHPIAQAIIEKRGGKFPPMISQQNFRYRIKEICKKAELNDQIKLKTRNGKAVRATKWKSISPHAARRAFASGLFYGWFNRPMPAAYCMTFTGHSSEKSFLLYIDAKAKEVNEKALEYFDLQPRMKVS